MMKTLNQQSGLTLIEMMVSLVISLIILAGLYTIYSSNKTAYQRNTGLTQIQESGRYAISMLAKDIRMAGYPKTNDVLQTVLFNGSADNTGPNGSDVLVIRHGSQLDPTENCMGVLTNNTVPLTTNTVNTYEIRDTGRINNAGRAIFALMCNNTELVEGIENMQVLYGIDSSGTGTPSRYVTLNNVTNWSSVVTIQIAILASSVDDFAANSSERSFVLADQTVGPFAADRIIRRAYTTTSLLRNHMP
ncbi:MAG: PilW family protein [Gammaproteobacteria bacterium]|nr:PilW family protein [Gammaproteobacteria bacterium]